MNDQSFPNPFKTELPDDQPLIIMSRTFDAPLALVWKVWTEMEHVGQWWGFGNNTVIEYDVRPRGKWRIDSLSPDGTKWTMFGTYLAVEPKSLIRNTFVVDGMAPEDERYYEEHQFEERDGKTFYRSISNFPDIAMRNGVVDTGMEWGANVSMVQFDAILERLKAE
ncbi:SRPBCC domain-containing protein [Devosia sediminis]|uniref:SRPBCC domain-containing protein n=1 Tax=Devosia sediminis TaxID=2798801 RepID=A0A934MKF1_9HYPH|nr:SRPBCC domain-containing protein [Devosia sediminis]MBJ3785088.1 SRPBCC domain-containing protein [Devosia sediminis]